MNDDRREKIPMKNLISEDAAHELATSPDMQPYLKMAMAVVRDSDATPALEGIARLPLEKRYVWRVASALKWGFADFDDLSVDADRQTLSSDDLAKVMELLRLRPLQFCMFLKALVGVQEMQRMMAQAVSLAEQQR